MVHVANNSGNNEWYTPSKFIEAARLVMGGIDCDPASNDVAQRWIGATTYYTAENCGLDDLAIWWGCIWMNPPYARGLVVQFVEKLIVCLDTHVEQAVTLTNNATETKWFAKLLSRASAVCLVTGRVKFIDSDGNPSGAPLQGQAFCYFGKRVEQFGEVFQEFGPVLVPR
jgi:hypothetical protein